MKMMKIRWLAVLAVWLIPAALPAGPTTEQTDELAAPLAVSLPSGTRILAEVADTPVKRRLGLMFRERLPSGRGMLLVFKEEDRHGVWMKNCRFPLDALWLDEDRVVVYMKESLFPCRSDPCPIYYPAEKARYILELNAGLIRREKIRLGDSLKF